MNSLTILKKVQETNSKPDFSVIIPTYNHGRFINRCLDSLIKQSFQNWEAIVINNFSEDNTVELVEGYNDHRIKLFNYRNHGIIAASRNFGIIKSRAEWICFLDSDDWWYPGKLEACFKHLQDAGLIYHDLDVYSEKRNFPKRKLGSWKLKKDVFSDLMIRGNAIHNSSVVVRKDLLLSVGCFSENKEMVLAEDFDCWLKVSRADNRFIYLKSSLGGYWIGNNLSSASDRVISALHSVYGNHLQFLKDFEIDKALSSLTFRTGLLNYAMRRPQVAINYFIKAFRNCTIGCKFRILKLVIICFLLILQNGLSRKQLQDK